MDKTLGQIAHEAADVVLMKWDDLPPQFQDEWQKVASAVAAAVKEEDARICEDAKCFNYDEPGDSYAAAIRASIKEAK